MLTNWRGPPRGFGEQGNKGIYFRGTGEQRPNFEGNRGTKTILGNREHKKTFFFDYKGTGEQANLFQGTREHVHPWEGLTGDLSNLLCFQSSLRLFILIFNGPLVSPTYCFPHLPHDIRYTTF